MKERNGTIDIMKGILVIGMVFGHCLQFFSVPDIFKRGYAISEYINLITFPGFVFCFGFAAQSAYLSKNFREVWSRILKNAFKTLIAFYISGLAFEVFIENRIVGKGTIGDVIFLRVIPGWSEFIISFSFYMIAVLVIFKGFKWLLERKIQFLIVTFALLFTAFIPYGSVKNHILGLLIGTREFPVFPILQYMPFFLLGMYVSRYKVRFNLYFLIGSFLISLPSAVHILGGKGFPSGLPERFPPSILWVMAPFLIIYIYYLASALIGKVKMPTTILQSIGSNTLIYLLVSNILIFALDSKMKLQNSNEATCLLICISILTVIYFLLNISVKQKRHVIPKTGILEAEKV